MELVQNFFVESLKKYNINTELLEGYSALTLTHAGTHINYLELEINSSSQQGLREISFSLLVEPVAMSAFLDHYMCNALQLKLS